MIAAGSFLIISLIVALNGAATNAAACNGASGEILATGMSQNDINQVVNRHNEIRQWIREGRVPGQPKGINLKVMKWDQSLAAEAQKIANSCRFAHVPVKDNRFYVGQNLFLEMSSGPYGNSGGNWLSAINAFYDEYKNFRYPTGSNGGVTGHYTQLVWANTEYVGCAVTYFKANGQGFPYQKFYVCNYGPGGNYVGQAPYPRG